MTDELTGEYYIIVGNCACAIRLYKGLILFTCPPLKKYLRKNVSLLNYESLTKIGD